MIGDNKRTFERMGSGGVVEADGVWERDVCSWRCFFFFFGGGDFKPQDKMLRRD